jgi:enoyl-CoA hydratase/carnithine racemase
MRSKWAATPIRIRSTPARSYSDAYSCFDYQRHGQHLMLASKDQVEGARSFVEKRAANFKGE